MDDFFRNHNWFFVRQDVLKRDDFRCRFCRKRFRSSFLEVDHIIPVRKGIDPFEKMNLRTLCRSCHKAKTRLEREVGF